MPGLFHSLSYLRLKCEACVVRRFANRAQRDGYTPELPTQRQLIKIPSRDTGRRIRIWVYPHLDWNRSPRRPVMINWHGSGFVAGGFGLDHVWCTEATYDLGMWVIDADYRKAPENPFPAAVHDAEDVLRWVSTRPDLFDLDRVAVSGFASGATLALVAASTLRRADHGLNIRVPVVFYPITNSDVDPVRKRPPQREHSVPLSIRITRFFNECYVPNRDDRLDPRVSPDLGDLESFPDHVVFITAEHDIFAPEGMALADNLRNGHRTVISYMVQGANHGFDKDRRGDDFERRRATAYSVARDHLDNALQAVALGFPQLALNAPPGDAERLRDLLVSGYRGPNRHRVRPWFLDSAPRPRPPAN
ncbi:unnamed protein product [Clonostachys rhizophaga]|uniref:Alpha/beta hydrolase fold-3 domain-containing protein n=1 Tax=Clonostachys rhizophaga TaxID=160324 RepID=A0A9N9YF21_9HYPO|nr:unnamed protein product [Clonostachys rhizophaga]